MAIQRWWFLSIVLAGAACVTAPAPDGKSADLEQFIDIPAGVVSMGCVPTDTECLPEERPTNPVSIAAFRMARHEVTVTEFRRFVDATGYRTEAERSANDPPGCFSDNGPGISNHDWRVLPGRSWRDPGFMQSGDEPVVCVTWNDAHAYADWMARTAARRIRLPTEAEWEYAARAGSASVRFWGDAPADACRYANVFDLSARRIHDIHDWDQKHHECDDGHRDTAPVSSFAPNDFGLYDMIGNVWEWTADCYVPYAQGAGDSSAGVPDCTRHIHRGAAWFSSTRFTRLSKRYADPNGAAAFSVGFRLAEDAR